MGINTTASTGARGAIRMGEETAYGVVVSPTHIIDFNTESLSATENVIESEAIREDRGRHKLIQGTLDVAGDITYEQSFGGFGMIIRQALGDYVKCAGADGGISARLAVDAVETFAGHDAADKFIVECTPEANTLFTDAGQTVGLVYRDASNVLVFDDNAAAGHAYTEFTRGEETYVTAVAAADVTYTAYSSTAATKVTLADTLDEDGNLVAPEFAAAGGIVYFGSGRTRAAYFEYQPGAGGGADDSVMWLDTSATDPSVNDAAIGVPCFVKDTSTFTLPVAGVKKGAWLYEYNSAWPASSVFTHHIERGRVLPVGLTIEVNRDAAIFLYSGMKVNSISWNYDANSIVTSTVSYIGKQEYAMAELVGDVIPDAASIIITDGTTFPTTAQGGGTFTIGEETGIEYTTKVDNADGTTTLSGITTGITGIQRFHKQGSNVDSRSSTKAGTVYSGNTSPLTAFESNAYIDGSFEEVLAASVTMTNNLNGDKFGLGSRYRFALVEEQAVIEASITVEFDDGKNYVKFKNGTFFSLKLNAISEASDSQIGQTGVLSGQYLFLPKCKFTGSTPNISGTSFIQHDMPITAIVDDDYNTTDLTVVLVNNLTNDVEAP